MNYIYNELQRIAGRCHKAAAKRGKDTTGVGCIRSLRLELSEYWQAKEKAGRPPEHPGFSDMIHTLRDMPDKVFEASYRASMHNTPYDELADIVITAATWLWEAQTDAGGFRKFKPGKSIDVMLLSGALHFAYGQVTLPYGRYWLREVIRLKMRFNELRKD